MEDIIREQIKKIAKVVKISFVDESTEKFIDSITAMIKLSQGIDNCEVKTADPNLFFNFPFQSLPLLDLEKINLAPKFHRKTIDNMICVPRFVGV